VDDIFVTLWNHGVYLTSRFLGLETHRDGQLQIALPCLHSILPKQPSFAFNSAFDSVSEAFRDLRHVHIVFLDASQLLGR
jgi:hypothetical protein